MFNSCKTIKIFLLWMLTLLISSMLLSSCYSTDKILRKESEITKPIDKNFLNFIYSNKSTVDTFASSDLWTILRRCKSFKKEVTIPSATDNVKLSFDGNKRLTISLVNKDNITVSEFCLKVKIYRDYLSIKRNLFVVPFPFIFYRHNEIKAIISNDASGNLVVKTGENQFIWILIIAGGRMDTRTLVYKRQQN